MKKEKGKINFMLNKIEIVEFRTELYIYILLFSICIFTFYYFFEGFETCFKIEITRKSIIIRPGIREIRLIAIREAIF